MDTVSVRFFKAKKWAIDICTQIEVSENEVVDNLPIAFAKSIEERGHGKIVESKVDPVVLEEPVDNIVTVLSPLTYSELYVFGASTVKKIANELGIKSGKKKILVDKILDAQMYTKDYLICMTSSDLKAVAIAKGIDIDGKSQGDVIVLILDSQQSRKLPYVEDKLKAEYK